MGDGNVKLLMFSDIEGCQKWNLAGSKKGEFEQSGFLCNPAFYTEMRKRLIADPNLHIAFLGDYFDHGMGVYDSIIGMNRLLTEFNKDGKERIFVILGNRDVNKLRFCFELVKEGIVGLKKGNRWESGFGAFFDNLNGKTGVALANCILFHSMGAKIEMGTFNTNGDPTAKLVGLHSFLPSSLPDDQKQNSELALKYLKAALGIDLQGEARPDDALDLLDFFSKCKLADVFDGPGGKVLLAHGGGFDSDAFFDQPYVYTFEKTEAVTGQNYHIMLEEFRRKLSLTVQSGGDRTASQRYGDDQSKRNKYGRKQVPYSVDVYNTLLRDVLKEIRLGQFTWKFVLLQALGLKPDSEDARYKSLIQSCSQDGCKGPNDPLTTDKDGSQLAKILNNSGITHVSYGHKPICFPNPVIYRRKGTEKGKEIERITFISNDTSNGNRKIDEVGNSTAIGTMVIFDPNGVQSLIKPIELGAREGKVGLYEAMYAPLTLDTTPFYEEENGATFLRYGNKKVVFNAKGVFDQLKFEDIPSPVAEEAAAAAPAAPAAAAVAGGRRRSRNRKRNTKRVSRYISKRTRRNKQTRRGRKIRKY